MKKTALGILAIPLMFNHVYAKDKAPVCYNLTVFMTNTKAGLQVTASWKIEGTFPHPSEVIRVGDSLGYRRVFEVLK